MKKRLLLGLVAVAVVVSGITAGAVLTQVARADDEGVGASFAARVATILGLEEDTVQSAFEQAGREVQNERFRSKMARQVADGKITEDEAQSAITWYEGRPEGIGHDRRGHRGGPGSRMNSHRGRGPDSDGASAGFGRGRHSLPDRD